MKRLIALSATSLLAACGGGSTSPVVPPPPPPPTVQNLSWSSYCTAGSPQFCASVELTLAPDANGTQTSVTVRMRNLEGTQGSVPWRMENVAFSGLVTTDSNLGTSIYPAQALLSGATRFHVDADSSFCASSSTPPGPCPQANWGQTEWLTYPAATTGRGGFYWTIAGRGPMTPSIVGCGVPANQPSNFSIGWGAFQTCGNGWVEISFSLAGTWTFDSGSAMKWSAYSDQGDETCYAGVNCAASVMSPVAARRD